jgi:HAD superfamily hydrolase (TIGR01509 family)
VSRFDLVIFDCDGVLVDSEPIAAEVGSRVLGQLGWTVTPRELTELFMGCTEEFWHAEVSARVGRELKPGWESEFVHLYEEAFDARLEPVPGVTQVLSELTYPVCVASNGTHRKIRANLARVGLLAHFDDRIFSAEDVSQGKPAPDLFLHAARTLGADPARCAVIEDSPPGVAAARAAGMTCFAYSGGQAGEAPFEGGATTVFSTMHELPILLGA